MDKMNEQDRSILQNRKALALCPSPSPYRSSCLSTLAVALLNRYQQLRKVEDLEECIALMREVLILRPPGDPDRPGSLGILAAALLPRYQILGKVEDLDEVVSLNREGLALCPPGNPDRSRSLNNLAAYLMTRYQQLGKMEDLNEAIVLDREALSLRAPGHPSRPNSLAILSSALMTRHHQLGKVEDLEESISLAREALALCPPGNSSRSTSLSNLASILITRFQRFGKIEDLDESISSNLEALAFHPPGDRSRSSPLINLSSALLTRYQQLGKMEDLEESISLTREVLTLCPPGHPSHSTPLNNLAHLLNTRYQRLDKIEDLEESILLNRKVLALHPPGRSHHPSCLGSLASALGTRYKVLGNIEDLEECISLNRQAITFHPNGHPSRSHSFNNLAIALLTRFQKFGKTEDIQETFAYYEQAANDSTSYLKDRLVAANKWAEVAREHQHQSVLNAYAIALELLHRTLISRPDVEAQHRFLATAEIPRSLASDAASAAIEAQDFQLAVEFLEQGRAMLWSKIDGYKSPLEQLRQVEGGGELADRLAILSAELEHLVLLSDNIQPGGLSLDARIKKHRILSEEWECLVGKIREMPGLTHFLQTPPFDILQSAAAEGPVILINISDYRSDAVILTISKPPVLVPLSTLEPADLRDQVYQLKSNLGIVSVLRYLWNNIVFPVVSRLSELGVEKKSRIWWCPTAELCALPLHAAGPYRPREPNLLDMYTSSYTATLSTLIRARSNVVQLTEAPKLLVVGQPHETLQKVGDEVAIIKEYGDVVDVLLGVEASHEAVLDGLKSHPWVHFACHGHLGDDDQPFQASFELYNGRRLTLLELIQARLPNAESAFLASCHSAAGGSRTPDENIHLSAALQFCGFRSVVGTLWEMNDEDGPMIAKEFYSYMFRNPAKVDFRDSAYALGSAIREMRKAKLPPERWVMFVHIGA